MSTCNVAPNNCYCSGHAIKLPECLARRCSLAEALQTGKISAVQCLSSLACRYIKNNRRVDGRKVKSKRKLRLSSSHKELQKNANSRKNLNFKMEGVFVVKRNGIGFWGRLMYFPVQ